MPDRVLFVRSMHLPVYPVCGECDCNVRLSFMALKIDELRAELEIIRANAPFQTAESLTFEIIDRIKRAKNVIVYNFPESLQTNETIRMQDDRFKIIQEILSFCFVDVTNITVKRMGPHHFNVPRPLRVYLNREQDVRTILKQKRFCTPGLKFFADRTPMERHISKYANATLNNLRQQGFLNTELRYIRGIPYIIEARPQVFPAEARALVRVHHENS